jgi:hypothetical protein
MTGRLYILTRNGRTLARARESVIADLSVDEHRAMAFVEDRVHAEIGHVMTLAIHSDGIHISGVSELTPGKYEYVRWWFRVDTKENT